MHKFTPTRQNGNFPLPILGERYSRDLSSMPREIGNIAAFLQVPDLDNATPHQSQLAVRKHGCGGGDGTCLKSQSQI